MNSSSQFKHTNVTFFSTTNMFSSKAYTITIRNTLEAVFEHGFSAQLIAPDTLNYINLQSQSNWLKVLGRAQVYFRTKFESPNSVKRSIGFIFHEVTFIFIVRLGRLFKEKTSIWTRSYLAPIFLGNIHKYILEIHQPLSAWHKFLLLVQTLLGRNVILAPISESLYVQVASLHIDSKRIVKLPMSVTPSFSNLSQSDKPPEYDIGYFGSLRVNSQDQGVFQLIEQLISCRASNPRFRCLMVGFSDNELKEVQYYLGTLNLSLDWISIHPRVAHSLVPSMMQNCEYLVIPYPENKFQEARFPLKALEYACSFRPILASRTKGNRAIFCDDEVFFYDYRDRFSIKKTLDMIRLSTLPIARLKSIKVREKALRNSYFHRAKTGLEALNLI